MAKSIRAALGFRVKSGWAMAVLLCGTRNEPRLITCREVLLSDPEIPQSKQPYHAALNLPAGEARAVTESLCRAVRAAANQSVGELLKQVVAEGYQARGAACVVGSLVDPATLHNEHIRAHGLEGQLFRTALEAALGKHNISCMTMLEKGAYDSASHASAVSVVRLKRMVNALGASRDGSWRAEEKLAALAAWTVLG
jgi:hypothetical protein